MSDSDKDLRLDDEIDITDDLSSDDLVDEDTDFGPDDEDEGIFTEAQTKKKTSGLLFVGILLLSFGAGAAFYFYGKEDPVSSPIASIPVPEISEPSPNATQAVIPEPVSDFDQAPVTAQNDAAVTLEQSAQPSDSSQTSASNSAGAEILPEAQSTTADTQTEKMVAETPAPEIADAKLPEPEQPLTDETKIVEADKAAPAPPADEALKPADQVSKKSPSVKPKNELEAARETINLPKEKAKTDEVPEIVYFDAPKGKALTDIPPPSINPEMEPGRSIIIVHKGKLSDDGMIVEKGEDNGLIESRLVNANRAASLGSYDAALKFYDELYKKNPSDPRILMGRAVTLQKLGETQKAIDGYRDVLDVEPNNPEAITNLMGLIGKTQPAVALQNLLDLKDRYPRNAAVAAQLGLAYAESGNPQDGLKQLNAAATLQPENPLHFFNMAVIYDRLKDRQNAIRYYEQALDTYSVNGEPSSGSFSREQVYDRLAALRGN